MGGKATKNSKPDPLTVHHIVRALASGESPVAIQKRFGITQAAMRKIKADERRHKRELVEMPDLDFAEVKQRMAVRKAHLAAVARRRLRSGQPPAEIAGIRGGQPCDEELDAPGDLSPTPEAVLHVAPRKVTQRGGKRVGAGRKKVIEAAG